MNWQIMITSSFWLLLPHFNPSNNFYDKTSTNKVLILHHNQSFSFALELFCSYCMSISCCAFSYLSNTFWILTVTPATRICLLKRVFTPRLLNFTLDTIQCPNSHPGSFVRLTSLRYISEKFLSEVEAAQHMLGCRFDTVCAGDDLQKV